MVNERILKRQIKMPLSSKSKCQIRLIKKNQLSEMASLRSPSSPTDGYKRFSDDFANTSVNNYGSNVASKHEVNIYQCTVAAAYCTLLLLTIHT